jgi:8-oxo-dGTP diphosphatase
MSEPTNEPVYEHGTVDERFRYCHVGRHWGPRGAAGILPWAVTADGRAWVLLSHRSAQVAAGGTWSTFGGAIDIGETPWQAAVRETGEEICGIDVAGGTLTAELEAPCLHECGWSYRTFVVRLELAGGQLPAVHIATAAAWETEGVRWVPADEVGEHGDLHPGLQATWPALGAAISAGLPH